MKQTHHTYQQAEKSALPRTLWSETHQELYQAILKHMQESTKQVQPAQPQRIPERTTPLTTAKTNQTKKEPVQTQTGTDKGIQSEISKLLEQQRPVYVNYYYSHPLTGNNQAEGCEPSHPYHTEASHTQPTFQKDDIPIEIPRATTQNQATDRTVIVQPWQSYTSIPIPNLNEPPPQKITKEEKQMVKIQE